MSLGESRLGIARLQWTSHRPRADGLVNPPRKAAGMTGIVSIGGITCKLSGLSSAGADARMCERTAQKSPITCTRLIVAHHNRDQPLNSCRVSRGRSVPRRAVDSGEALTAGG